MTTMTYDSEFDLDRFVAYLEKLRINRPRAASERRLHAEGAEPHAVAADTAAAGAELAK